MKTKTTASTEQKTLQQFISYYELCNRAEDKSPFCLIFLLFF